MSETTNLLFDLIIWCQVAALLLNTGIFAWLMLERRRKEGERWKRYRN